MRERGGKIHQKQWACLVHLQFSNSWGTLSHHSTRVSTERMTKGSSLQNKQTCNKHFHKKKTAFLRTENKDARKPLYPKLPKYYVWRNNKLVGGGHSCRSLQCLSKSSRMILLTDSFIWSTRGPKSFQDLRRVNGEVCKTSREPCYQQGLLENHHWELALPRHQCQIPQGNSIIFSPLCWTCAKLAVPFLEENIEKT